MSRLNVTDEEIVVSLFSHRTIKEVAEDLKISERTIYQRMQTAGFRAIYNDARNQLVRNAVINLNQALSKAVKVTIDIVEDDSINPATRLQACQTVINSAIRLSERLTTAEGEVVQLEKDSFLEMMI